jgi:hypothetical protein
MNTATPKYKARDGSLYLEIRLVYNRECPLHKEQKDTSSPKLPLTDVQDMVDSHEFVSWSAISGRNEFKTLKR